MLVKWERQTKSSLTNITSDQYCRPSVWEAGWARRLPTAASVQNKMHRSKKTPPQIHILPRRHRSPAEKHTHKYKHTERAVTGNPRHPVRRSLSQSQFISALGWLFPTGALKQPQKFGVQLIPFICRQKSY